MNIVRGDRCASFCSGVSLRSRFCVWLLWSLLCFVTLTVLCVWLLWSLLCFVTLTVLCLIALVSPVFRYAHGSVFDCSGLSYPAVRAFGEAPAEDHHLCVLPSRAGHDALHGLQVRALALCAYCRDATVTGLTINHDQIPHSYYYGH